MSGISTIDLMRLIFTFISASGVLTALILWLRWRKHDRAKTIRTYAEGHKLNAEGESALGAAWETLSKIITIEWDKTKHDLRQVQQDNLALQQMIATERQECDDKIDALERHHSEKMHDMETRFTAEINKLKNKSK